jgi:uncharacterized DUF497 family protein
VSFELGEEVWDDPLHVTAWDRFEDGEERWLAIGRVEPFILLVVRHTVRVRAGREIVRIISARKATLRERRHDEQESL